MTRFQNLSPRRQRIALVLYVLVAAFTTWNAVAIARAPDADAGRVVLASAGAAIFVGFAVYALWLHLRRASPEG